MTVPVACRAPVLLTPRLQLVGLEPRHFPAFARMHADPSTMRHIGDGLPLDRVSAWLHLAMLVGHWDLRGYGVWAVEQLGGGDMIGRVGLFQPEGWDEPELSWMIAPALRGRGFAFEAARAALDHAFVELGFVRIMSLVRPANHASRRVAEKLGGVLDETVHFFGEPTQVFRYERESQRSRPDGTLVSASD